jgi:hypothetical protein
MPRTGASSAGFGAQGHKSPEQFAGGCIRFTRRRLLLHAEDRPELPAQRSSETQPRPSSAITGIAECQERMVEAFSPLE